MSTKNEDPTDAEIAAMLHHRHARRTLGFYHWSDPDDRRSALRRLVLGPRPERLRPAWKTWNRRNMSDTDELSHMLTFAHATLDIIEVRRVS